MSRESASPDILVEALTAYRNRVERPRDLYVQLCCKHCAFGQEATVYERPATLKNWGITFRARLVGNLTVKSIVGNRISPTTQELAWVCGNCETENLSWFPWIAEDQEPPSMTETG